MQRYDSEEQQRTVLPRTPKRGGPVHAAHLNWFPYYAGYNPEFVHDVLHELKIAKGDNVLDPWNGSGTTTSASFRMGANAVGCDINPVMVIAAKGALLDPTTVPSLGPIGHEIVESASTIDIVSDGDPLSVWYSPASALALRRLHFALWRILVDPSRAPTTTPLEISNVSSLAAFFLTALMRTVRYFLAIFVGSNPTWIRHPTTRAQRVAPRRNTLNERFLEEVRYMTNSLEQAVANGLNHPQQGNRADIAVASSTSLPYDSSSIDAVVSSPPYLTRIDYAVATKPELATLGMDESRGFDALRRAIIGAPTVRSEQKTNTRPNVGKACNAFLDSVRTHSSKGSHNYYYRLFHQYFDDMNNSLKEISRVLKSDGRCVLVVQDSYYKELHADLAKYLCDIAKRNDLSLFNRHDFAWSRNMVRVNSRSRKYRDVTNAVESVLWFGRR